MKTKFLKSGIFIGTLILLGAGCGRAIAPAAPFWREGAGYARAPSTTIGRGAAGYFPAPALAPGDIFLPADALLTGQPKSAPDAAEPAPAKKLVPRTPTAAEYTKAVNDYRSRGAYFQFVNCRGNPGLLTLKRGTGVMLDNRDAVAHKFFFATASYTLAPYGFVIAKPQVTGLLYITCDGGGAAAVNVQP